MRSFFARWFGIDQDRKARPRRLGARVERLESRNLMTAGSVVQLGAEVTVTPASTGPNTTLVSYQNHAGTTMLDVNLNGHDYYFVPSRIDFVYYWGSGISSVQTFQDTTQLNVVAFGGSGANLFEAGSGQDDFYGGTGSNTFDAGTGFDVLVGGAGPNVFNESTGSGEIVEVNNQNTIDVSPGVSSGYLII